MENANWPRKQGNKTWQNPLILALATNKSDAGVLYRVRGRCPVQLSLGGGAAVI